MRKRWREEGFISPALLGAIAGSRRRTAAANPSFGAVAASCSGYVNSSTQVLTLTSTIATGTRGVLIFSWVGAQTISSIADNASVPNTWTIHQTVNNGADGYNLIAASAPITSQIPSGTGTVTVTFGSSANQPRIARLCYVNSSQNNDTSASASGNSSTPNATASGAANITAIGAAIWVNSSTITSSDWTQIGTIDSAAATYYVAFFQKDIAAAGTIGPNVVIGNTRKWAVAWASSKA